MKIVSSLMIVFLAVISNIGSYYAGINSVVYPDFPIPVISIDKPVRSYISGR